MLFHHRRVTWTSLGLCLLTIYLIAGCVSSPDLAPAQPRLAVSSPTPFQPLVIAPGSVDATGVAPLLEPTFTPFPTRYVVSENPSASVQIASGPGAGGFDPSLLASYDPLTGMQVSDPSRLDRRPMAIKVANAPDYIRPQSGLTLADVVFEYYIEWGDTRFIAVIYGNDSPMVGPVRSGRYFDEHVARMYNAFLVFKYADPREYSYLKDSTLHEFLIVPGNGPCPPFVIGPETRDTYNNIFFNTARWANCALKRGVDNSRPTLRGGFFSDQPPASDLSVNRIYTYYSRYNYNFWEYDPVTHKYFRNQEANDMINGKPEAYAPLSDLQTGLPVTADNVVELFVPYEFANPYDAHDEVYHIELVDSGNAYLFRDGVALPARWNRVDVNQPLLLTTLDGNPLFLHPGRTFYEVIGATSSYTEHGTDWKFNFAHP